MTQTHSPKSVVEAYVEGTRTRNIDLLKSIFHADAVMTGWLGPDLLLDGPEPFFGALETNEVGDDYAAEIVSLSVTDKIATAELAETNLLGMSFTNLFHVAQMGDGSWRNVSKLFRHD